MLTLKQQRFATNIASGMRATDAARAAGYACSNGNALSVTAARLMKHPDIQREAFIQREARLTGPLACKALSCLEAVLDDETAPTAARVQAARFVLEAGGHGIENRRLSARHPEAPETQLSVLSLEALEEIVKKAELRRQMMRCDAIEAEEISPPPIRATSAPLGSEN